MVLTTKEARCHLCPIVGPLPDPPGDGEPLTPILRPCMCIAQSCMMWRWADPNPVDMSPYVAALGKLRTEQEGADPDNTPERKGYCGLAGKPEYVK
jgi:hypothetical protein